jgi:hypothetical protein
MAGADKVTLVRVRSSHNRLRTASISGWCRTLPKVGARFFMTAEPLDPQKDVRMVTTSPVSSVSREGDTILFDTQNSTYRLRLD